MANNSIVVSRYCNDYQRIYFECCSNTSSTSTQLIGRTGSNVITSYASEILRHYTASSSCTRFRSYSSSSNRCRYSRYYFTSSYQGVYTCRMTDSNGQYNDFSMGIYPYGFNSKYNI